MVGYAGPMQIVKITERMLLGTSAPPKCGLCPRNVRVGQWALRERRSPTEQFLVHASCLKEAVAGVPEDDVDPIAAQATFERQRRELRELAALAAQ